MSAPNLTDDDVDVVADRVIARQYEGLNALPVVPEPAEGTWEHAAMVAQERKRQERIQAFREREERAAREREAEEQRRREEWERNAPRRAKALEKLKGIEEELRMVDEQREALASEMWELRRVAAE